ncbi:MAG: hypothetical protein ACSLE0_00335 [Chitinophagaceae bacterium]
MQTRSIKGNATAEIKVALDALLGFFSYGEFGRSKTGKHEFHNNTCCIVALKEK